MLKRTLKTPMDKHEAKEGRGRTRKCAASGEICPESRLIRFVADPDGMIFPDVSAKAPGRGIWVGATASLVDQAIKKNLFSRGLKRPIKVSDDLMVRLETALEAQLLDLLGFARRAGVLETGFDAVSGALRSARPAWRLEATDGAADGRQKLDALARQWQDSPQGPVPVCAQLSGAQMGMALGRDNVIHALVCASGFAARIGDAIKRLEGFRPLVPSQWAQNGR